LSKAKINLEDVKDNVKDVKDAELKEEKKTIAKTDKTKTLNLDKSDSFSHQEKKEYTTKK
jgi:transcriptional antiterminator Rof (Rho-off)